MTVATLNVIQTGGIKVFDLSLGALAADLPAGEYPLCLVDAANAAINDALATPDSVRAQLFAALKECAKHPRKAQRDNIVAKALRVWGAA
jgi:hypothetical protein